MTITTFNVPTMNCSGCAEAIVSAVRPAAGVSNIVLNVPARLVQVEYDGQQTSPGALKGAIEGGGYRVQRYSDGLR